MVEDGGGAVVLCPFASRFPYQTAIAPWPLEESFCDSPPETLAAVGGALARALRRLKDLLDDPPFNAVFRIETNPAGEEDARPHPWRIEVFPRLTALAGFELGAGVHINEVAPEDAAAELRGA